MLFKDYGSMICGDEVPHFWIFDFSTAHPLLFYSYIPIIVISLLVSFYIYEKNKRSIQTKGLVWFNLFFVAWVVNILIQWVASFHSVLMLAWQLTAILEVGMYLSAAYFAYVFILQKDVTHSGKAFFATIALTVLALTPTTFNVSSYDVYNCEGIVGYLWTAIYVFEPLVVLWIILFSFIKSHKVTDIKRRYQIRIFSIGLSAFLILFFLSNLYGEITKVYEFNLWGPLGMVIFLVFLFYVIVKFKAFNLKALSAQALVVGLVSLIFALFFVNDDQMTFVIQSITLLISIIFGFLLIRSVKREVEQRERIEKLATELQKANDRLRELDKQKSEFVSFATHQLRAPLTAMKGYCSMILEGDLGDLSKTTKDAVERIYESSTTLASVVDDYLNISRIELGTMKYLFDSLDLKDLVVEVIAELQPNIDRAKVNFSLTSSAGPFIVKADKDKIKQVIANLVDNAVKYTPHGKIVASLSAVSGGSGKPVVRFETNDNGIGIAPEVLPKLFSKFTRADNGNRTNIHGTGLGLFVAKEIVGAHKGKIWAESEGEGKGSRFVVELPVS